MKIRFFDLERAEELAKVLKPEEASERLKVAFKLSPFIVNAIAKTDKKKN